VILWVVLCGLLPAGSPLLGILDARFYQKYARPCALILQRERLAALGYAVQPADEALLGFALDKAVGSIKNDCNLADLPEGLQRIAVEWAAGEFLQAKKAFAPDDLAGLDLEAAVKQIQAGDTNTVFATGEASLTPEQRLNNFLNYLMTHGLDEFACYRKLRW